MVFAQAVIAQQQLHQSDPMIPSHTERMHERNNYIISVHLTPGYDCWWLMTKDSTKGTERF